MMQFNALIHTIHVPHCYSEHELFLESVDPYLETNGSGRASVPYKSSVAYRARFWDEPFFLLVPMQ
jgi:hypothetical protein